MNRVWRRSNTPWRSTGSSARGGAGRGRATATGRRPRYSEARGTPKTRHAGAVRIDVATCSTAAIKVLVARHGFQRDLQECSNFFLEIEQRFGLLQPRREVPILLLEFLQPRIDGHRFAAAFLRRQSPFALLAPGDEMRGVESLFPQQRAELAVSDTGVGLSQHLQLVGGK